MYSWKIFKYPFGRFFCWIIVSSAGLVILEGVLFCILCTSFYYKPTPAGINLPGNIGDFINLLITHPEYITKHYLDHCTWSDDILLLLIIIVFLYGIYFSHHYAMRRALFYQYKYIRVTVPFDKISIKHVLFIILGYILFYSIPSSIFYPEPKPGLEFLYSLLDLTFNMTVLYVLLNLYMTRVSKIEWLSEEKN